MSFIPLCHLASLLKFYIRDLGLTFAGTDMAQLICGGCRTLLMYARGATSVRCSCCHTVNLAPGMKKTIIDFEFREGYDGYLKLTEILIFV